MLIPCPHCGPRDETEFAFGGEPVTRPSSDADDGTWAAYLYGRSNERGPHRELWCHAAGCGRWFVLRRDTVTHTILPPDAAA